MFAQQQGFGGARFGQQPQQQGAQPSLFGAPAPTPGASVFGTAPAPAGGFGGFGGPARNGFGAPAAAPAGTTAGFKIGGFGGSGGSTFGGAAPAAAPAASAFGAAPAPLFGGAAPASSPFGTKPAAGGFGFGTAVPAPAAGAFGTKPGGAFGLGGGGGFGSGFGTAPVAAATPVGTGNPRFQPVQESDPKTGVQQIMTITAMPEFMSKSIEELRWEDYQQGRRSGGAGTAAGMVAPAARGSIFGAPASAPAGGGLFGAMAPAPAGGLFGAPAPAPAAGGLFGASAPAPAASASGFTFGQQRTAAGGGGLFGAPAVAPSAFGALAPVTAFGAAPASAAPTATFGGFGAPAPAPAALAPAAAGAFSFGSAPAPAPATSTFGGFGGFGATPAPAPAPTGGGLFGAASAPAPAAGGLFGPPAPAPAAGGIFGAPAPASAAGGLFGAPAPAPAGGFFGAPAPAPGGLFGSPAPAPAGDGLFGTPAPAPAPGGLFSAAPAATDSSKRLFGVTTAPTPAPTPGGLFGGFGATLAPAPAPLGVGLFGQAPALAPVPGGLFGGAGTTMNLFGGTAAPAPAPVSGLFGGTGAAMTAGGLFGGGGAGGGLFGGAAPAAAPQMGGFAPSAIGQAPAVGGVAGAGAFGGSGASALERKVNFAERYGGGGIDVVGRSVTGRGLGEGGYRSSDSRYGDSGYGDGGYGDGGYGDGGYGVGGLRTSTWHGAYLSGTARVLARVQPRVLMRDGGGALSGVSAARLLSERALSGGGGGRPPPVLCPDTYRSGGAKRLVIKVAAKRPASQLSGSFLLQNGDGGGGSVGGDAGGDANGHGGNSSANGSAARDHGGGDAGGGALVVAGNGAAGPDDGDGEGQPGNKTPAHLADLPRPTPRRAGRGGGGERTERTSFSTPSRGGGGDNETPNGHGHSGGDYGGGDRSGGRGAPASGGGSGGGGGGGLDRLDNVMPRLTKEGYGMLPYPEELSRMTEDELRAVEGFAVVRADVGAIEWKVPVDIRGLDLDRLVSIEQSSVAVYEGLGVDAVPVGAGLNCPARVTLQGVYPKRGGPAAVAAPDGEALQRFQRKLEGQTARNGSQFVSYEPDGGVWVFDTDHFSRYGLEEDSDDDDGTNGAAGDGAGAAGGSTALRPPGAAGGATAARGRAAGRVWAAAGAGEQGGDGNAAHQSMSPAGRVRYGIRDDSSDEDDNMAPAPGIAGGVGGEERETSPTSAENMEEEEANPFNMQLPQPYLAAAAGVDWTRAQRLKASLLQPKAASAAEGAAATGAYVHEPAGRSLDLLGRATAAKVPAPALPPKRRLTEAMAAASGSGGGIGAFREGLAAAAGEPRRAAATASTAAADARTSRPATVHSAAAATGLCAFYPAARSATLRLLAAAVGPVGAAALAVPPAEDGECLAGAATCDMGLLRGRSFGVSWGPCGELVRVGAPALSSGRGSGGGFRVIMGRVSTVSASARRGRSAASLFVPTLRSHMRHARCTASAAAAAAMGDVSADELVAPLWALPRQEDVGYEALVACMQTHAKTIATGSDDGTATGAGAAAFPAAAAAAAGAAALNAVAVGGPDWVVRQAWLLVNALWGQEAGRTAPELPFALPDTDAAAGAMAADDLTPVEVGHTSNERRQELLSRWLAGAVAPVCPPGGGRDGGGGSGGNGGGDDDNEALWGRLLRLMATRRTAEAAEVAAAGGVHRLSTLLALADAADPAVRGCVAAQLARLEQTGTDDLMPPLLFRVYLLLAGEAGQNLSLPPPLPAAAAAGSSGPVGSVFSGGSDGADGGSSGVDGGTSTAGGGEVAGWLWPSLDWMRQVGLCLWYQARPGAAEAAAAFALAFAQYETAPEALPPLARYLQDPTHGDCAGVRPAVIRLLLDRPPEFRRTTGSGHGGGGCAAVAGDAMALVATEEEEEDVMGGAYPRAHCLLYHLLRLHVHGGDGGAAMALATGGDDAATLAAALDPLCRTPDVLDYRHAWPLAQVLSALAPLGSSVSSSRRALSPWQEAALADSVAFQLLSEDAAALWPWAAFVLMHGARDDARTAAVRALVVRHAGSADLPRQPGMIVPAAAAAAAGTMVTVDRGKGGGGAAAAAVGALAAELRIPAAWLAEARAYRAGYDRRHGDMADAAVAAGMLPMAEAAVAASAPAALFSGKCAAARELSARLRSLRTAVVAAEQRRRPPVPLSWSTCGGWLCDYMELRERLAPTEAAAAAAAMAVAESGSVRASSALDGGPAAAAEATATAAAAATTAAAVAAASAAAAARATLADAADLVLSLAGRLSDLHFSPRGPVAALSRDESRRAALCCADAESYVLACLIALSEHGEDRSSDQRESARAEMLAMTLLSGRCGAVEDAQVLPYLDRFAQDLMRTAAGSGRALFV